MSTFDVTRQQAADLHATRAAHGEAARRRNTPMGLLVLSLALFLIATASLFWGISSRNAAVAEYDARVSQAINIREQVATIKDIKSQSAKFRDTRANEPLKGALLTIRNTAPEKLRAALEQFPGRETPGVADNPAKLLQKKYQYSNLRHDSIEEVMTWIQEATTSLRGLEVESLTIRPEANAWQVNIVFSRWERKES